MKLVIEIPEEFEVHFDTDKFKNSLERLREDAHSLAGNYEKELANMLIEAFKRSKILPKGHGRLGDLDALEQEMINGIKAGNYEEGYEDYGNINSVDDCVDCVRHADTVIEANTGDLSHD